MGEIETWTQNFYLVLNYVIVSYKSLGISVKLLEKLYFCLLNYVFNYLL